MRNRIARSRFAQIALTYTKPLGFRIWLGFVVLYLAWLMWPRRADHLDVHKLVDAAIAIPYRLMWLLLGGMLAAWLGAMTAAHAKEQLADPRASLAPRYRAPHLIVAAIFFVTGVAGLAGIVVARVNWVEGPAAWWEASLAGYLALILATTASLAWIAQLQSPVAALLLVPVFAAPFFTVGRDVIWKIVTGQAEDVAAALLALATLALTGLWWRLAAMNEEMVEYGHVTGGGLRLSARMTADPVFRRESAAGAGPLESFVRNARQFDRLDNIARAGFWRRARHWRRVIGLGRMPFVVALVLAGWTLAMPVIIGARRDDLVALPLAMAVLVPGLMVAGVWPRRWYMLADESLRPASRRQFVREQGAAMAIELAVTAAAITFAAFCAGLLLETRGRWSSPLWPAVPLVLSGQVVLFGVIVWVLRYRAGWLVIVPLLLVTLVGAVILALTANLAREATANGVLGYSLAFLIIGLAITFDAYRRWLTTEFG